MHEHTGEFLKGQSGEARRLDPSAWTHPSARPFVVLGTIGVVGGGLLSAAIAPTPSYHGSWAVAYVVLVVGVAQVVLGVAQTAVTDGSVRGRMVVTQAVCWNVGSAATITGTLLGIAPILYFGAVLQIFTLALFLLATRHLRRERTLLIMRVIIVILIISAPVGIILQALTH